MSAETARGKGTRHTFMEALGQVRTAYTNLIDLFTDVADLSDTEAVEVALADLSSTGSRTKAAPQVDMDAVAALLCAV